MINMMKADLYRIFRGIGIYIAIAMVIIMSSISIGMKEPGYIGNASVSYEETAVEEDAKNGLFVEVQENAAPEQNPEQKLLVRSVLAANINLYYPLIIVVFVILMSDFSNQTLKNTLTSAVSKRKYFAYKLIMSLGFSILFILISNLFAYVLNFLVNGRAYTESIVNLLKATVLQMPMLLGIVSFFVCIGFFTRRTAVYNAISISFVMLFQIILSTAFSLTESKLIETFLEKYEWQAALGRLAYFPENKYCLQCLCFGVMEIVVFSLLSYFIFKKSEIK